MEAGEESHQIVETVFSSAKKLIKDFLPAIKSYRWCIETEQLPSH